MLCGTAFVKASVHDWCGGHPGRRIFGRLALNAFRFLLLSLLKRLARLASRHAGVKSDESNMRRPEIRSFSHDEDILSKAFSRKLM